MGRREILRCLDYTDLCKALHGRLNFIMSYLYMNCQLKDSCRGSDRV